MPQILGQELGSSLSNGGVTQDNITSLMTSQQHNEYSINGSPSLINKPSPSRLDPNVPATKYSDNLPR